MAREVEKKAVGATADLVGRKADVMSAQLSEAGYQFDPATIIAFVLGLVKFFKDCIPTAEKAHQRLRAFGRGRYYFGANLDEARVIRMARDSGCCDQGCPEDMVVAAARDAAGSFTLAETQQAYS